MQIVDYVHTKGDTFIIDLAFSDDSGAINITGAQIVFILKDCKHDTTNPILTTTATITNGVGGLAKVTINPLDQVVGEYFYTISITDTANVKTTPLGGAITISL